MNDQTWRKIFVGREKELKILETAWKKAKGNEPQFITFLAETGVGKTRLVQHFYTWLHDQDDLNNYWPGTLECSGGSLAVNPVLTNQSGHKDIPWLWWGLRASDPAGCNPQQNSAIRDSLPRLEPHVEPIALKRYKNNLTKDTAVSAAISIANLISLGWFEPIISVYGHVRTYQIEKQRQKEEAITVAEVEKKKEEDVSQKIFDYIKTILNKEDADAPTVPVILVLDDAQWMDKTTLSFVEKLWIAAKRGNWPLLIIATHWLREWRLYNEALSDDISPKHPPQNLVDLIHRNPERFNDWKPHELHTLPGNALQSVLEDANALPGLKPEQQESILDRVGGNPQFLDDIILWIQGSPKRFFGVQDCSSPLTDKGEELVETIGKGHRGHIALIQERFGALDEDMCNLLGFGSYQGMRFVEPLTLEVAQKLYGEGVDWKGYFGKAIQPYTVINRVSEVADEFRQRNMFEIAREYFKDGDESAFRVALLSVLRQWFSSGRMAKQPVTDREILLILLVKELEDVQKEPELLIRVQINLVELYRDSFRSFDAFEIALKILETMPESGWPLTLLSISQQNNLAITLIEFSYHNEAVKIYSHLIEQMEKIKAKDANWKNNRAVVFMNRGHSISESNRSISALKDSDEGIRIERELLDALENYDECIRIKRELRDTLGKEEFPSEWKNGLAIALARRGLLLTGSNNFSEALSDFDEAILIGRELRDALGEKFLPEWQNDLAKALTSRGRFLMNPNHSPKSLKDNDEFLSMFADLEEVIEWENLTCADSVDFNKTAEKIGDAISIISKFSDARGEEFLPEQKNDLTSISTIPDELLSNFCKAREDYNEAILILSKLLDLLGENFPPEWQNNLAMAYYHCGLLMNSPDNLEQANHYFNQAYDLGSELHQKFGDKMKMVFKAASQKTKHDG
jgi:tetratricopeptide (TPR) repeat protein